MQLANEQLGWISHQTPSIMVAGTNGKGTTSAFLWRLLALGGVRCGLFSSPHLVSFAERIQMSDRAVTEGELEAAIPDLIQKVDPGLWQELSFFEASLLLAMHIWRQRNSELNILEVGLGGRLDATNISSPDASIITSIGIDHTGYLGAEIRQIAFEKAGILRPGKPVFVGFSSNSHEVRDLDGRRDDAQAIRVIAAVAEVNGSPVFWAGRDFGVDVEVGGGQFYFTPAPGVRFSARVPAFFADAAPYLLENFAVAAATAIWFFWSKSKLESTSMFSPSHNDAPWDGAVEVARMFEAFSEVSGPWGPALCGRFQQILASGCGLGEIAQDGSGGRRLLVDVCHNPHGAKRFVEAVEQRFGGDATLPGLVSIVKDKDIGGILDVLSGKLRPLVLFKMANDRGFTRDVIPERYRELPFAEDFSAAAELMQGALMQDALAAQGHPEHSPWVVCGSVMAVGEVLGRIEFANSRIPPGSIREQIMDSVLRWCLDLQSLAPSNDLDVRGATAHGSGNL